MSILKSLLAPKMLKVICLSAYLLVRKLKMEEESLDSIVDKANRSSSADDSSVSNMSTALSNLRNRFFVTRLGLLRNTRKILGFGDDFLVIWDCQSMSVRYTYSLNKIDSIERTPKKAREFVMKIGSVSIFLHCRRLPHSIHD